MSELKDSKEQLFDSYLKLVGDEYAKIISEEVDKEPMVSDYPKSLDLWFESYNKRLKRKHNIKKFANKSYTYLRRIAAVFVVVVIVSTILVLNVEAVRIEFLNFFINEESNNIHIQSEIKTQEDLLLEDYHGLYLLGYVPEGYILKDILNINDNVTMTYLYQEKRIVFIQQKGSLDTNIDNERMKVTPYKLENGENAILSESDDYTSIVWKNDTNTFIIEGNIDRDSIIMMVENVDYKK